MGQGPYTQQFGQRLSSSGTNIYKENGQNIFFSSFFCKCAPDKDTFGPSCCVYGLCPLFFCVSTYSSLLTFVLNCLFWGKGGKRRKSAGFFKQLSVDYLTIAVSMLMRVCFVPNLTVKS